MVFNSQHSGLLIRTVRVQLLFRVAIITAVIIMIKSAIGQVEHDRTASVTCADGGGSAWSG